MLTITYSKQSKSLSILLASMVAVMLLFTACGDDNGTGPDPDPPEPEPGAPSIESIEPDSATIGTPVVIYGSNFSATAEDNAVTFNGTEATVTDASTDSLVTSVPEGATSGPLEVTVNGETTSTEFTVIEAENSPIITSIEPLSGGIGTEVTIIGENFSATPEDNKVYFNGTQASVISASETQLVTEVPEGASTGPIKVTVNGNLTATSSSEFEVVIDNMMQAIAASPDLSTFAEQIRGTQLETTLQGSGPFTVLAPTNAALNNLPDAFWESLNANQRNSILSYYVIEGDMTLADLEATGEIETLNGETIFSIGTGTFNNKFSIADSSAAASYGQIHKVIQPLLPDAYLDVFEITYKRPITNKFACHCISDRINLDEVLHDESRQFTVFAPSTDAFNDRATPVDSLSDAQLQSLMNNHIYEGDALLSSELSDGQTINTRSGVQLTISVAGDGTISVSNGATTAQVIVEDLEGTNGVVYVIDGVLETPAGG